MTRPIEGPALDKDEYLDDAMAAYDIRRGVTPRRLEEALRADELGLLSAGTGVPVYELRSLAIRWGLIEPPQRRGTNGTT